jgi:uncharacterized surface protein with fasciclin (FAS1) repeats
MSRQLLPGRGASGSTRPHVPTVQGGFLQVDARGSGVHINGSTAVTTPNVFASNGVVHIIDSVLLPH